MIQSVLLLLLTYSTPEFAFNDTLSSVIRGRAVLEWECEIDDSLRRQIMPGTCSTVRVDSIIYNNDSTQNLSVGGYINVFSYYSELYHIAGVGKDCIVGEDSYFFLSFKNDSSYDSLVTYRFATSSITASDRYFSVKESRGFVPDYIPYAIGLGRTFKSKEELEKYIEEEFIGGVQSASSEPVLIKKRQNYLESSK